MYCGKQKGYDRRKSKHRFDKEIHVERKPKLPNVDRDLQLAKRYLQSYGDDNETLWGHLVELIHRIMVSKRDVTPAALHHICRRLRERKLFMRDWLIDVYQDRLYLNRSIEQMDLFTKSKYKWNWEERVPDTYPVLDDKFLPKLRMVKYMGFCLPEKEVYDILMAMRTLADDIVVAKIAFWGKLFGISRDYYVVECDIEPSELDRLHAEEEEKIHELRAKEEAERLEQERLEKEEQERLAQEEKAKKEKEKRDKKWAKRREKERIEQEKIAKAERLKQRRIELARKFGRSLGEIGEDLLLAAEGIGGEGRPKRKTVKLPEEEVKLPEEPPPPDSLFNKYVMPKLPEMKVRRKIEVPAEPYGEGLNKKEYYVCNLPGEPWVKLPDVTPAQIQVSRRIKRFLTGDLEAEIVSLPVFPGKEKNYLRAMIARISATTEVSPVGYYTGGGEEEDGAGEGGPDVANLNPEYHGVSWKQLYDKSHAFWAHHHPYILPQGRLKWWKPPPEEEEEGEGGESSEVKPEQGPPLLQTLTKDNSDDVKPWSLITSSIVFKTGVAVMARSNIWPGATATALEFNYQYLYVGWGQKFSTYGYTPPFVPPPADEYEIGPEILEMLDPTPEEEEAWRIAHMPKEVKPLPGEGGEGGEGAGGA